MNLAEVIDNLRDAVSIGREIGLSVERANDVLENAEARAGFTGETFVLAFIGGTGVGKSTLLNALAGQVVSEASVIRPTTSAPLAWVSDSRVGELESLFEWVLVGRVVTHRDPSLRNVAMVDMPDFDSIVADHRLIVDEVLPRVDMVLWVVDPEKYDDERLHNYLRVRGPNSPKLHVVLSKIDHLSSADTTAITTDISEKLGTVGFDEVQVYPVSGKDGSGIATLKDWVSSNADAKTIIAERIRADAESAMIELARAAGLSTEGTEVRALLEDSELSGYVDRTVDAALEIVDPEGVAAQLKGQYRDSARMAAASLLGRFGAVTRSLFGKQRREADPVRYILNWRTRGDLGRIVNPVRDAYMGATSNLDPSARAAILTRLSPDDIRRSVSTSIDATTAAVAQQVRGRPAPLLWRVLTPLQWLATVGFVVAVVWYLTILFGPADIPVGTVEVPILGPIPSLLALLLGSAALSLVVALVVNVHASILSRKRARHLGDEIRKRVSSDMKNTGFGPLLALEEQRRDLASLVEKIKK